MIEAALAVVFVIAALVLLLFLWGKKKQVSLTRVSLPFAEFSVSNFDGLPPVMMFAHLSMLCLPVDPATLKQVGSHQGDEATPSMMIHSGWTLVCDAFIRRFGFYPNDEEILKTAAELGGQNVEFIQMYRGIYNASVQHANSLDKEFAANYLVRAPAMVERINGGTRMEEFVEPEVGRMVAEAERIVNGVHMYHQMKKLR